MTSSDQHLSESVVSKRLPQVDKILRHAKIVGWQQKVRREVLANIARRVLGDCRLAPDENSDIEAIVERIDSTLLHLLSGGLTKVINGTGIILSTNLGRAPIPAEAVKKVTEVLAGYSNLELDMRNGKRGERTSIIEQQLAVLTGCESALLVNNNAAAVLLAVSVFAAEKEVIVSRGELIEIGGSFRLPDVIESAGAKLREVGTTNRTRIEDYRKAINADTRVIMKCHRSNFEITGFTEEAKTDALVALARENNLIFVEDLGSGALVDLSSFNLKHEPTVAEVISADVDVVMFSGDKLMGGSQAGIICGKTALIKKLRQNAMYRALRADKLTIALLEQVLAQYLKVNYREILPVLKMATTSVADLTKRAENLLAQANEFSKEWQFRVHESSSTFGGGTLPGTEIESVSISIECKKQILSADKLLARLRQAPVPVIGIIHAERVLIDLRTVAAEDEAALLEAFRWLTTTDPVSKKSPV